MVKSELLQKLCNLHPNIFRRDLNKCIEIILFEIANGLRKDELGSCELRNFGRFSIRVQKARIGRNPATGTRVEIPMKNKVHFKASSVLLKRLNRN